VPGYSFPALLVKGSRATGTTLIMDSKRASEPARSDPLRRRLHDAQSLMSCGFPVGVPGVGSLRAPSASVLRVVPRAGRPRRHTRVWHRCAARL